MGCGTGFWLPRYAREAAKVIGVEPDPALRTLAIRRVTDNPRCRVVEGSAEHLPLPDQSVDVVHARFAYFFGQGAEAGLAEVCRVLRPGGVFNAIDNDWSGGDFADLLRDAVGGNANIDPKATLDWWSKRGDRRIIHGGWQARSPEELQRILRIEFPGETIERWVERRPNASD